MANRVQDKVAPNVNNDGGPMHPALPPAAVSGVSARDQTRQATTRQATTRQATEDLARHLLPAQQDLSKPAAELIQQFDALGNIFGYKSLDVYVKDFHKTQEGKANAGLHEQLLNAYAERKAQLKRDITFEQFIAEILLPVDKLQQVAQSEMVAFRDAKAFKAACKGSKTNTDARRLYCAYKNRQGQPDGKDITFEQFIGEILLPSSQHKKIARDLINRQADLNVLEADCKRAELDTDERRLYVAFERKKAQMGWWDGRSYTFAKFINDLTTIPANPFGPASSATANPFAQPAGNGANAQQPAAAAVNPFDNVAEAGNPFAAADNNPFGQAANNNLNAVGLNPFAQAARAGVNPFDPVSEQRQDPVPAPAGGNPFGDGAPVGKNPFGPDDGGEVPAAAPGTVNIVPGALAPAEVIGPVANAAPQALVTFAAEWVYLNEEYVNSPVYQYLLNNQTVTKRWQDFKTAQVKNWPEEKLNGLRQDYFDAILEALEKGAKQTPALQEAYDRLLFLKNKVRGFAPKYSTTSVWKALLEPIRPEFIADSLVKEVWWSLIPQRFEMQKSHQALENFRRIQKQTEQDKQTEQKLLKTHAQKVEYYCRAFCRELMRHLPPQDPRHDPLRQLGTKDNQFTPDTIEVATRIYQGQAQASAMAVPAQPQDGGAPAMQQPQPAQPPVAAPAPAQVALPVQAEQAPANHEEPQAPRVAVRPVAPQAAAKGVSANPIDDVRPVQAATAPKAQAKLTPKQQKKLGEIEQAAQPYTEDEDFRATWEKTQGERLNAIQGQRQQRLDYCDAFLKCLKGELIKSGRANRIAQLDKVQTQNGNLEIFHRKVYGVMGRVAHIADGVKSDDVEEVDDGGARAPASRAITTKNQAVQAGTTAQSAASSSKTASGRPATGRFGFPMGMRDPSCQSAAAAPSGGQEASEDEPQFVPMPPQRSLEEIRAGVQADMAQRGVAPAEARQNDVGSEVSESESPAAVLQGRVTRLNWKAVASGAAIGVGIGLSATGIGAAILAAGLFAILVAGGITLAGVALVGVGIGFEVRIARQVQELNLERTAGVLREEGYLEQYKVTYTTAAAGFAGLCLCATGIGAAVLVAGVFGATMAVGIGLAAGGFVAGSVGSIVAYRNRMQPLVALKRPAYTEALRVRADQLRRKQDDRRDGVLDPEREAGKVAHRAKQAQAVKDKEGRQQVEDEIVDGLAIMKEAAEEVVDVLKAQKPPAKPAEKKWWRFWL